MLRYVLLIGLSGCSGSTGADGGTDGAADDASVETRPEIPWLEAGTPPIAAPMLTPCPAGWREVDAEGLTTCDPYPEGGVATCTAPDEAHFPGEPGCRRVGPACPADGVPVALPTDRPVLHVSASAGPGGDGSRARPYSSPTEFALGGLGGGTVIALGVGAYDATLRLPARISLVGACVDGTSLTSTAPSETEAVVNSLGAGVEVRTLRIADPARLGVAVNGPGRALAVEEVLIERAETIAALVLEGTLAARDLVIADVDARPSDGQFGRGLEVGRGGQAELDSALLVRSRHVGASATNPGSSLALGDSVVRDTQSRQSDLRSGRGLNVQDGAAAVIERSLLQGNRETAALGSDAMTVVRLEDVVVRDTIHDAADGTGGDGLSVQRGAQGELARVVFDRNRETGVFTDDTGTVLVAEDLVARDTEGRDADRGFGRGLSVQAGVRTEIRRAAFVRSRELGIFVYGAGATAQLDDLVVRDTLGSRTNGHGGHGVTVQLGGRIDVTRALVHRNHVVGLSSVSGSVASLVDVVVQETTETICDGCSEPPFGTNVVAYRGGTVAMDRFLIHRAPLCGMMLALDGQMDVADGKVSTCGIGACIQIDGYDVERLTQRVTYEDNGTNLQTTDLPVPDPVEPVTGP